MTTIISDIYKIEHNVFRKRFYMYLSKLGYLLSLGFDLFKILTVANDQHSWQMKLQTQEGPWDFRIQQALFVSLCCNKHKNSQYLFHERMGRI